MLKNFDISTAIITYFGFLVALTMHEAAHAYVAKAMGDKSAETESRATINPVPHIDVFGTIVFPLVMLLSGITLLFGWAKPTQADSRYFKKPKRDINIVALSGPAFNILIAVACGIAMRFMGLGPNEIFQPTAPLPAILQAVATMNIVIAVFNMIPFPASDSWRIITNSVNYNLAQKMQEKAGIISVVMLLLLILGVFHPFIRGFLNIFYFFVLA